MGIPVQTLYHDRQFSNKEEKIYVKININTMKAGHTDFIIVLRTVTENYSGNLNFSQP